MSKRQIKISFCFYHFEDILSSSISLMKILSKFNFQLYLDLSVQDVGLKKIEYQSIFKILSIQ